MDPGTTDDEALRAAFEQWLAARWPEARELRVGPFESPKSGFSARTLFAPLRYRRDGEEVSERIVLRIESPEPAIYPQQAPGLDVEVEIQYRVMECLAETGKAPIARLVGYEPDPGVLGSPFFAMEHVAGQVLVEQPSYTKEGFFFDADPALRRRMIENGLRALATLHTVDHRKAGLEWLADPARPAGVEAQLALWEAFGRRELGDRAHPVFDAACSWLRTHLPSGLENGFGWGDSRPGNIIYDERGEVRVLTDFENAAIHPPEVDLGWWLMFDRTQHEWEGNPRLEGEPTRDEQRAFYEQCAGRRVGDTHYYEVLAGMRYTAIVVRVMNRAVDRGFMPPDHEIWLRNPAADILADLMDLPRP